MPDRCFTLGRALATAALLALPVAAQAADLRLPPHFKALPPYPEPIMGWAGWYAGLHAGYGFGDTTVTLAGAGVPGLALPRSFKLSPEGFLAGAQIGYNGQWGNFVLGGEADIAYSSIRDKQTVRDNAGAVTGTLAAEQRLDWFGTVRGRLGYVLFQDWLIYGTGGLAYGQTKLDGRLVTNTGINAGATKSEFAFGYTFGGGAEYAIMHYWTVRAEYLYYDLGTERASFPGAVALAVNAPFKGHIVRAAVNYRF
jgi:outer membrane immunogenic protein